MGTVDLEVDTLLQHRICTLASFAVLCQRLSRDIDDAERQEEEDEDDDEENIYTHT